MSEEGQKQMVIECDEVTNGSGKWSVHCISGVVRFKVQKLTLTNKTQINWMVKTYETIQFISNWKKNAVLVERFRVLEVPETGDETRILINGSFIIIRSFEFDFSYNGRK